MSTNLPSAIPTQFTGCTPFQSANPTKCMEQPNAATQCLAKEMGVWQKISSSPVFSTLQLPARYRLLSSPPFDTMPMDALRLNITGGVPISSMTTANRYYQVIQYLMPLGFDGVINNTLNKFVPQTGPDFQDGSGQLTWLIAINNYLVLDYSNINITQGSQAQLGPVTRGGGIRLRANDLVTMYVSPSAAGLSTLDPQGIVIGAFQGWRYSNR